MELTLVTQNRPWHLRAGLPAQTAKHAISDPALLLSMVYYIDRLCALYPEFTINTLTVHRFHDHGGDGRRRDCQTRSGTTLTYARVGGVRVAELKLLELEFPL